LEIAEMSLLNVPRHTHQFTGSPQQQGEDYDKEIRMHVDAAIDFSQYNVVILAYSQGIFSKSP
jgi:hypothetical protein